MSIIRLQGEAEVRKGIYYQLDSSDAPIGIGGMGQVFKGICVDTKTNSSRPVAIKFMYDDLPPASIERARREASIQLRNDNLIEMLGFIETEEKRATGEVVRHYHVVSELLTGVSLADLMNGNTKDRNGQDVAYAVKLLQDYQKDPERFAKTVAVNVLSGLMALHDAGYIHRDIDPSNIMVTTDGHIKLIDFGIAKQMNTLTTSDKSLTVAGKFMGKPEYAAPELALGDIAHQNQTTDIYAIGVLLYLCIVGHTPFEGARHEILEKQIHTKMPLQEVKNKAMRAIIERACEKKQEARFPTSAQMRVALETMSANGPGLSPAKKKMLTGVVAACVAALCIVGIVAKSKNDAAKAKMEQANIEKQKSELMADINMKIEEGDNALKIGMDSENDNYEKSLMNAYNAYSEAEKRIQAGKTYNIAAPDIAKKKQEVLNQLETARTTLLSQADALEEAGETATAEQYRERAKSIENFKK